ncbi:MULTISPECIES: LysR family transcriptional regulator [unclassified Rhizobium]|uniref:LysR family transcriptional regulator n=1 Tax=unclassified Rhizobium TaxID=2613769 RepID=UPI001FD7CA90|nr:MULTISPECIES: LysR family transcriptional regulator [unclassified Rhizobium]
MIAFVRIADTGSLSAAAAELDQSLPVVSRRLTRLEERLGVRLVNRTTRQLSLTDEGVAFHMRCSRILTDIEEAEAEVSKDQGTAVGLLRITTSFAFSRRKLAGLLRTFESNHPGLRIHLDGSDRIVNLVDEGFDIAIRFGAMQDSSLIARAIAPNAHVMCASPTYLDKRGRPTTIEELALHDCILHGSPPASRWTFENGKSVKVGGDLTTNDGDLAHIWALEGAGIVMKSIWDVAEDVHSGNLEIVMPKTRPPATPVSAVFPHSRLAAARVRLVIDFLTKQLRAEWEHKIAHLLT